MADYLEIAKELTIATVGKLGTLATIPVGVGTDEEFAKKSAETVAEMFKIIYAGVDSAHKPAKIR